MYVLISMALTFGAAESKAGVMKSIVVEVFLSYFLNIRVLTSSPRHTHSQVVV